MLLSSETRFVIEVTGDYISTFCDVVLHVISQSAHSLK